MTFKKELNTKDRLFLYDDISIDTLLYLLSKKNVILDLQEIGEHQDIDNIKKEKILVTIGVLCDKGYAKERADNKSVEITLKGKWRLIYNNPTYIFWGLVITAMGIITPILLTNTPNTGFQNTRSRQDTSKNADTLLKYQNTHIYDSQKGGTSK